jgi:aminopeptidase
MRAARLNEKRYAALHYRGPGTDFRLGLADDHRVAGRRYDGGQRLYCIPNMPTEEVFSTPHKDRAEGTVTAPSRFRTRDHDRRNPGAV